LRSVWLAAARTLQRPTRARPAISFLNDDGRKVEVPSQINIVAGGSANASQFSSHQMGSSDHPGPAGYRARQYRRSRKGSRARGRDIAALDIRKGVAHGGGVIIIDDDLETVRELSFKEISKPSGQI
jgi:hypothetical protein